MVNHQRRPVPESWLLLSGTALSLKHQGTPRCLGDMLQHLLTSCDASTRSGCSCVAIPLQLCHGSSTWNVAFIRNDSYLGSYEMHVVCSSIGRSGLYIDIMIRNDYQVIACLWETPTWGHTKCLSIGRSGLYIDIMIRNDYQVVACLWGTPTWGHMKCTWSARQLAGQGCNLPWAASGTAPALCAENITH